MLLYNRNTNKYLASNKVKKLGGRTLYSTKYKENALDIQTNEIFDLLEWLHKSDQGWIAIDKEDD